MFQRQILRGIRFDAISRRLTFLVSAEIDERQRAFPRRRQTLNGQHPVDSRDDARFLRRLRRAALDGRFVGLQHSPRDRPHRA